MALKDRRIYDNNTVEDGRFLRGVVVDNVDPFMEGRVAVTIPRLIHKGDPAGVSFDKKDIKVEKDALQNEEIKDLISSNVTESNAMWARPVKKDVRNFEVPLVGQTLYLIMEDGDPNKLYYTGFNPTIAGDLPNFDKVQSVADVYLPDKRPKISVLYEFEDGSSMHYNRNKEEREFRLDIDKGPFMSFETNEQTLVAKIQTPAGHFFVIDDQEDKGIHAHTAGGNKIDMTDDGKHIKVWNKENSVVEMIDNHIKIYNKDGSTIEIKDNNIKMYNKNGAIIDMKGPKITASAGGGKVVIGNGKVMIN